MAKKEKQANPVLEAAAKLVADRKAAAALVAKLERDASDAIKELGGFTPKEMAEKEANATGKSKSKPKEKDDGLEIEDGADVDANAPLDGRLMTDDQILAIHKTNPTLALQLAAQKRQSIVGAPNPGEKKGFWAKLSDVANTDIKLVNR